MIDTKSIYIVGPGSSIKDLDKDFFNSQTTLVFSGNLLYFNEHNIAPNYWTFLDPYTLTHLYTNYKNGVYTEDFLTQLKTKTTLLYDDIQCSSKFYTNGYTTSFGEGWMMDIFTNEIFPAVKELFKETVRLESETRYEYFGELTDKHIIVQHANPNWNPEKFCAYLLPLVWHYFPEVKDIHTIGFGDFNSARYADTNNVVDDYYAMKLSFDWLQPQVLNILNKLNINVHFHNPNSYYNRFQITTMDKITFCIPSKNNLRYLKTCIPSIRNNASRPDHDIFIFVDSDTDGTVEWLVENHEKYKLKYYINPELNSRLYGIGKAYDYCIEYSETDICMIFHADMMLGKNADLEAYKYLQQGTVVCSTRVEPPIHPNAGEKVLQDFGMWPEEFNESNFNEYIVTLHHQYRGRITEGMFAPWMIYKSDLLSIQGHDPIMHSAREDSDLFNRMQLAGYKLIQSWDSYVYHLTGRGGQFQHGTVTQDEQAKSEEWRRLMNNSTKEFIRKWGSGVRHTPLMQPIVSPKYDIGYIVSNCGSPLLEVLEPWCSTIYFKDDYNLITPDYIKKEQPNTRFDLQDKIKPYDNEKQNEILVQFDGSKLTQESFNLLMQLPDIIAQSGEVGEFELDIFRITIVALNRYESSLIKLDSTYYTNQLN